MSFSSAFQIFGAPRDATIRFYWFHSAVWLLRLFARHWLHLLQIAAKFYSFDIIACGFFACARIFFVDRIASLHKFISYALTKLKSRVQTHTHTRARGDRIRERSHSATASTTSVGENKNNMENISFRAEMKNESGKNGREAKKWI